MADPEGTIRQIYQRFNFELSPEFAEILRAEAEKAKSYKSKHRYSLQEDGAEQKTHREANSNSVIRTVRILTQH